MKSLITSRIVNGKEVFLYRDNDDPTLITEGDASDYYAKPVEVKVGKKMVKQEIKMSSKETNIKSFLEKYGN